MLLLYRVWLTHNRNYYPTIYIYKVVICLSCVCPWNFFQKSCLILFRPPMTTVVVVVVLNQKSPSHLGKRKICNAFLLHSREAL